MRMSTCVRVHAWVNGTVTGKHLGPSRKIEKRFTSVYNLSMYFCIFFTFPIESQLIIQSFDKTYI